MTLSDALKEVLQLQVEWTKDNTPAMNRRGEVVRREIPDLLRATAGFESGLQATLDLRVEGRDGTGLKTEVPSVRVHSESQSPHATEVHGPVRRGGGQ